MAILLRSKRAYELSTAAPPEPGGKDADEPGLWLRAYK